MTSPPDELASAFAPLSLFYCYARKDQALRDEIDIHLATLHRSRLITSWHDAMIIPGTDWKHEINTHLDAASIILLLVSPDFLHSDYCHGREMQRAIERHMKGEAHIIPILLRPVDWEDTPISTLQMLPTNAIPVTQWTDRDAAFADVARGIRRAVTTIIAKKRQQEEEEQHRRQAASADDLIARGKALEAQQRFVEALPLYQRATRLAPQFFRAWFRLGSTLYNLQRYDKALAAYDHALSLDPNFAAAWNSKGVALHSLMRYEETLDAYDQALSLNPNAKDAWYNKGNILDDLRRYQEALDAFDHALALNPTFAIVWSNKAVVLRQLGRTHDAQAADQRARQLQGS